MAAGAGDVVPLVQPSQVILRLAALVGVAGRRDRRLVLDLAETGADQRSWPFSPRQGLREFPQLGPRGVLAARPALQQEQLEPGDWIARAAQQVLGAAGPVGPLQRAGAGDDTHRARPRNRCLEVLPQLAGHLPRDLAGEVRVRAQRGRRGRRRNRDLRNRRPTSTSTREGRRVTRTPDASARPIASAASATITELDLRHPFGRGGSVTGAPGSSASSARVRSAPFWKRLPAVLSRLRSTMAAREGGTAGGSEAG